MASYQDYYKVLGVDRNADKDTIARAFKKLARKYHPDLNQGDKIAEEKFKEINEAYDVLKDPKKRQMYDQLGSNWKQGQQFSNADFNDIFGGRGNPYGGFSRGNVHFDFSGMGGAGGGYSDFFQTLFNNFGGSGYDGSMFGNQGRRMQKGSDCETELSLTLKEAQEGGKRQLRFMAQPGQPARTLDINVPAGIRDGAKLRLHGQGRPGPAGPGDLYVTVHYKPDPVFTVNGSDLSCDVFVAPWEAVLGGQVKVQTLEGQVEIKLPAGSSSGKKFRLRGRGLGPDGRRGDLLARIVVKVPEHSSEEELALWRKLAEISTFRAR